MEAPKHIDPTPPIDVIKVVWDGISSGRWTDLTLWANIAYLVAWALNFLGQKLDPDNPVFGESDPVESEFCGYCVKIYDWAADGSSQVQSSAIGAWLVKAMLMALLNRLLRELAADGLPDWLAEIIQRIKDQIEAL